MNLSEIFIRRPIMTTLVMIAILFFGIVGYYALPVSDLPNVEFPTIQVSTSYPGANPQTIAETVTSPLEREFCSIDGIQVIASQSTNGNSVIVLQFVLDKDIDAAAQDVQAAINQAQPNLPSNLPNYPTYQKTNPTASPILYLAISSDAMPTYTLYEYAYSFMGRRLGMVEGVSQAKVYGSSYAARIQVDPDKLAAHQIGIDEVAQVIQEGNPQKPTGSLFGNKVEYTVNVDGQIPDAAGYNNLIVRNNNGALVKIKDLGNAVDSLQNDKFSLKYMTKTKEAPCVVIAIIKQAGANTIKVINGVTNLLNQMKGELPASVKVHNLFDEADWIMESIHDVQITLILAFLLVVVVVFFYLGKARDTIIPLLALPLSVIGTFMMMYLYNFNIDILSLLAITLSIGFLVDDAIVVLENIARHTEMGKTPYEASLNGSKQISFTILSMTLCLISVFIPMVFMAGIMGRLFREFALTIVTAVLISGFVSLSLTPMLCSRFIVAKEVSSKKNWVEKLSERLNNFLLKTYEKGLHFVLKHRFSTLLAGLGSFLLTIFIAYALPTDFLPPDDLGFIQGFGIASDSTSPFLMMDYQDQVSKIIRSDENVEEVVAIAGVPTSNQSLMFIRLKPINKRKPMEKVVPLLLDKIHTVPGLKLFLRPMPLLSLDVGTQTSTGSYQYALMGLDTNKLYSDGEKVIQAMQRTPGFLHVISDMHNHAPYLNFTINRDRASDLNISADAIENTFNYAYSAGRLSLINGAADQYYVIIETIPSAYKDPSVLNKLYVTASSTSQVQGEGEMGEPPPSYPTQVPLKEVANWEETIGPLSITHINTLPATLLSFDLEDGFALSDAIKKLGAIGKENLSQGIIGTVKGSADVFKDSIQSMKVLFFITLFLIYMILGILYENFIHPLTVMSALPPAGLGGMLTLILFNESLSLYAIVGIIMLLGIVLKNGIMMIDFANEAIVDGKTPLQAIHEACCARLRPILMTTFAAMMGAVPIALGVGGLTAQSRRPLGLVIVGGLIVSQILTLFFTPVIFLFLEELREKFKRKPKTDQA
ncbi:MAG: efflux RND transporter permease subunit [Simkania negevensis]|nr:efflux RND transporter permease subunit [Simkania negevensis]